MADGPSWSDIAAWYDELVSSGSGPHETALECLERLLPASDLSQHRVIDVACGQGIVARRLASLGADVTGIDSSGAMIDRARGHAHDGIVYEVADAQTLDGFADGEFDGATCQLALMDIPDLDAALTAIGRVLRPGGWLVFVIGHPCFLAPGATHVRDADGRPQVTVARYFEERFWRSSNPQGVRRVGNHHRMLSTYLNALVRAGFALEVVEEPPANELLAGQQPLYTQVPIFFAARARTEAPGPMARGPKPLVGGPSAS